MRSGIAVGKESVRVSLVVRAGLRRTVMRRAKIVMVCCARVIVAVVGPWIVLKKVYGE